MSAGKPGYNSSRLCEGENLDTRRPEADSPLRREWEISPRDVGMWDALLSSILKSAGPQGAPRVEVLRRVAGEMAGTLYVSDHSQILVADGG